ncbi:MAG TPA: heavy-metal-associated domain-containing protein [Gemmatimonadales bacterium]|nr:heavy-metal-associated domain-containing protein [Gemmatimonadales bacterium]
MNRTTLKIDGMSCGHCVAAVTKALEDVEGVTIENVSIGAATVAYDPAVASPEKLAEAVSEAGYTATTA